MSLLGSFYSSVLRPAKRRKAILPLRGILRWPVIFDLVSFGLQVRDLGRLRRIRDNYGADGTHHKKVHDYNAGVTQGKIITSTRRAEELYEALALPSRDFSAERLLVVGPRNVQEIFIAWLHGFSWRNIEAIDLYSTNPKIQVMNMEDMSFPSNTFEAVAMSATLSYADDTQIALSEVARVLKPGGRFAFTATYDPGSQDWHGDSIRAATIVDITRKLGLHVYYYNSFEKTNANGRRQSSHYMAVQKEVSGGLPFDPLRL